jgi:hypothetical protein
MAWNGWEGYWWNRAGYGDATSLGIRYSSGEFFFKSLDG